MAAAAQTAAAGEAVAPSLDPYSVDGSCRRLEARDTRCRAAARRRLRRYLTRRVLMASACLGPKARKHDNADHCTKRREKWVVFCFFRCFCFVLVSWVIRRFRILLFRKTTNHSSGLQCDSGVRFLPQK